jgi:sigma-B regulation protein RsbU (phosphoserine phosphatase)
MAVLRNLTGGEVYPLRQPQTLIGRRPDCEIRVPLPEVSAHHALVSLVGDRYVIRDLESRNGTWVNGRRLHDTMTLSVGDRIELGGMVFEFLAADPAPAPAAPYLLPGAAGEGQSVVMRSLDLALGSRTEQSPAAKLRAVLEISRNLSTTLAVEEALPKILESLFTLFPQADCGFVLLRDPATGTLVPKATHRRSAVEDEAAISRTVVDHVVRTRQALLTADAGRDDRFDASQSIRGHQIRSVMCVPLLGQADDCLGVIQLDTRRAGRAFADDDLEVLVVASLQAARALELARLHRELRDLEAATQIQKSFLPAERPAVPGLRFFDYYASAGQVGGDYFDYVPLPGDRLAVAVGDVSGKGVTAALLMARLSAAARFCLATEPSVAAAVRQLNASLTPVCGDGRFITFAAGIIHLPSFELTLVNAGHMPLLRKTRGGEVEEVGAAAVGIPLGVFDRPYEATVARLEPGDVLLFYSDGVTEARDPRGRMYGPDRLREVLRATPGDAEAVGRVVLTDVQAFAAGRPPGDDLTLVCVSRDG